MSDEPIIYKGYYFDDYKDRILVKCEDLQWLLQMSKIAMKYIGRPVDEAREKRIKEEYKYEKNEM